MNTYSPGVPVLQTAALIREFTPETITGDEDDYAPAGNQTYNIWRLQTDATRHITGLAGGLFGTGEQVRLLINIGSHDLVLKNNSGSSLVGNRFLLADGADQPLHPGFMALCRYDATSGAWRALVGVDVAEVDAILADVTDLETRVASLEMSRTADELTLISLDARLDILEALTEARPALSANFPLASNTTALANVTGIGFAMPAGSVWQLRGTLAYNCTVAADLKIDFTGSATTLLDLTLFNFTDATGTAHTAVTLGIGGTVTFEGTATTRYVEFAGIVYCGGTAGTLQLRAAQNSAVVEVNTDFIVLGSNICAPRVL